MWTSTVRWLVSVVLLAILSLFLCLSSHSYSLFSPPPPSPCRVSSGTVCYFAPKEASGRIASITPYLLLYLTQWAHFSWPSPGFLSTAYLSICHAIYFCLGGFPITFVDLPTYLFIPSPPGPQDLFRPGATTGLLVFFSAFLIPASLPCIGLFPRPSIQNKQEARCVPKSRISLPFSYSLSFRLLTIAFATHHLASGSLYPYLTRAVSYRHFWPAAHGQQTFCRLPLDILLSCQLLIRPLIFCFISSSDSISCIIFSTVTERNPAQSIIYQIASLLQRLDTGLGPCLSPFLYR